ncbi:MAG TPA: SDR family oxidoreductase [Ktedonobacterales bacterium]|nr:SDR family oxidoreductase [Ktedonobacterales bacterium]
MELAGKIALVTGGSGDLGAAIARALAQAGASIAITYVGERERAEETAAAVEALGVRAWTAQLDQSDAQQAEAVIAATVEKFGRLDILVNNAAWNIGIPFADLDALTPDIWDRMYDTNLRGPFLLARAAARPMRAQKSGHIVNIASIGGIYPAASSIAYATSKAALIHLTRCLAVALAPDILVNCVAPGLIEGTRMAQRLPPQVIESARRMAVLGRAATLEDLAAQVVAFCRSDSVTGQTLPIDGGLFPR